MFWLLAMHGYGNKMHKRVIFLWNEWDELAIKLIYVMTAMKEYQNKKILYNSEINVNFVWAEIRRESTSKESIHFTSIHCKV